MKAFELESKLQSLQRLVKGHRFDLERYEGLVKEYEGELPSLKEQVQAYVDHMVRVRSAPVISFREYEQLVWFRETAMAKVRQVEDKLATVRKLIADETEQLNERLAEERATIRALSKFGQLVEFPSHDDR